MIRVTLPPHLRKLAGVEDAVELSIEGPATAGALLDALEARHPVLCGTIREHATKQRRPYVRFFACRRDWSHESLDAPLPEAVVAGEEPFVILGALAGG